MIPSRPARKESRVQTPQYADAKTQVRQVDSEHFSQSDRYIVVLDYLFHLQPTSSQWLQRPPPYCALPRLSSADKQSRVHRKSDKHLPVHQSSQTPSAIPLTHSLPILLPNKSNTLRPPLRPFTPLTSERHSRREPHKRHPRILIRPHKPYRSLFPTRQEPRPARIRLVRGVIHVRRQDVDVNIQWCIDWYQAQRGRYEL